MNEENDIDITEEELDEILVGLEREGIVESKIDETGERVYMLTEIGEAYGELLRNPGSVQ